MQTDILDPTKPMTRSEAAMISGLSDPEHRGAEWVMGLTPEHRKGLVLRMVVTIEKCRERGTDNDLKIYARLMGTLARFAQIEVSAGQKAPPTGNTYNTQINNGLDLSKLTVEQLKALVANGDPDAK